MWCKHRIKKLADGSFIGSIATYMSPPYIFMTKEQYEKLRKIYSRRRKLTKIKPIKEIDNLITRTINKDWDNEHINLRWFNTDWYEYKNRIFIFRHRHKIASLVITKNTIYNPCLACGGEYRVPFPEIIFKGEIEGKQIIEFGKIEKPPSFVRSLNKKYYFRDEELLSVLEPEKDKITKMLKDYFEDLDNWFIRFLQENNIIEHKIDMGIEVKDKICHYISNSIKFDIDAYNTFINGHITNKIKENKNENLTNEEKDYYELLVDLLDNGEISDSERNILNKRKEKYSISDSRASEIEEFAKQERLQNLKPQNDSEASYYELILDFMENGIVSENNRKILNKRLEKYGITEARAKQLEYFAKQEYLESKKVKFESEEEKEYYEFIIDLMENGAISENSRKILDKRKIKFGISETRAKELEEFAKQNNSASSNDLLEEGKTYYNNEEYDKAIEIFKKAVELNPDDYLNWNWLGCSYNQNGQYQEAINSLLKAVELNPDNDSNWNWLGGSYNQNGQYQEAINSLLKAVELNPDNYLNWQWLGHSYNQNGQYQEAINSLLKAVELNPDNDSNWYWLGNSYYENGQYQEAINSLLKAVELNPDDYSNWNWLGGSYNQNGQYQEAINSLLKAVELNPDDYSNWNWLGSSYYENGQYQEAINSLLKAIELNSNVAGNYYWLGRSYNDNQQHQEAIDSLIKATQLVPDSPEYWYRLCIAYNHNGQYQEAINSGLKATQLNPDYAGNWYSLGCSYYFNNQYQEAINSLSKAVELNPDNDCYWYFLGSSYLNFEDYNNAVYSFERSIEINPNDSDTWNDYGVALQRLNRIDEAKSACSKALEIDPNYETAKNNLQILQSSNGGVSLNGVVSGISKGIDTLNELSGKINPSTIGMVVGAAKLVGKFFGGSNKNK